MKRKTGLFGKPVAMVAFGCDSASLGGVLNLLASSKTRPIAVEVLNQAARRAGPRQ